MMFWYGVAFVGLLIPLLLDVLDVFTFGHASAAITVVAALMGLLGGLLLRYVILAAGNMPTYLAAGFEFRPVRRPKDPMPPMGKLPPS